MRKYTIMCNCSLTFLWLNYRHLFSMNRMSANWLIDCACFFLQIMIYNSFIFSRNWMNLQLFCQWLVGNIVFTCNDCACCVHINSMYDSGPQYTVYSRQISFTVIQKTIHQSMAHMSRRRMYNHSFWLINNNDIIIFI